jgi:GNAT superfamily N-acetyltransferase
MRLENHFDTQIRVHAISEASALQQFSDLLDKSFGLRDAAHFFDDFPVWDAQFQAKNVKRIGVFSHDLLVSAVGVRLAQLATQSKDLPLKVGIIGAVCTHPLWRGKGLASKAVTHAVQWAKENGSAAVFLWGAEHSLYQKLGFELCGQQTQVPIENMIYQCSNSLGHLSQHENKVRLLEGWNDQLLSLIRKRTGGLVLNDSDLLWYQSHKNVQWHYAESMSGPVAFAAYGRGIDLPGVIHEWGGENSYLAEVFRKIEKMNPAASLLASPHHLKELRACGWRFPNTAIEYLCMSKILNPAKVIRAFFPERKAKLDGLSKNRVTERQLIISLFGGEENQQVGGGPENQIPLWFWGLDAG